MFYLHNRHYFCKHVPFVWDVNADMPGRMTIGLTTNWLIWEIFCLFCNREDQEEFIDYGTLSEYEERTEIVY